MRVSPKIVGTPYFVVLEEQYFKCDGGTNKLEPFFFKIVGPPITSARSSDTVMDVAITNRASCTDFLYDDSRLLKWVH